MGSSNDIVLLTKSIWIVDWIETHVIWSQSSSLHQAPFYTSNYFWISIVTEWNIGTVHTVLYKSGSFWGKSLPLPVSCICQVKNNVSISSWFLSGTFFYWLPVAVLLLTDLYQQWFIFMSYFYYYGFFYCRKLLEVSLAGTLAYIWQKMHDTASWHMLCALPAPEQLRVLNACLCSSANFCSGCSN